MGKYMRKCGGVGGEVAAMEVSQVVGVRTRARTLALSSASAAASAAEKAGSKRRKAAGGAGVVQNSYLQLRSRSIVMTPRVARTPATSRGARARCPSPVPDRLSRCSSNASSEVASVEDHRRRLRSGGLEGNDDLENSPCDFECGRERRETTPPIYLRGELGDLGSTVGKKKTRRSATATAVAAAAVLMPPPAEVEEFFASVERANSQNMRFFGNKYNYDVANDAPLDGRYEWLRLKP